MSERGDSPGPVKMLAGGIVAESVWEAARIRQLHRGLDPSSVRLPNTRVQRTRSSASPPHSPLTRRPLGSAGIIVVSVLIAWTSAVAAERTPTPAPARCAIVEAVLASDGRVESAKIARSAGKDFDRKALAFVKSHRYPAPKEKAKDGKFYATEAVCPHE